MTPPFLEGSPLRGHNGPPPDKADNRPVFAERACPECGGRFKPRQANGLFCCPAHNKAWNNRWTSRGSLLVQYAAVARVTRDGTRGTEDECAIGKRCAAIQRRLHQRWRDEDRDAGRMAMPEFMAARLQHMDEPI